jgi:DNA-binding GntR family transcriptional regulator
MPVPSSKMFSQRKSAKEIAYEQIQKWIIDGTLLPGEKLNDKELADALGVSRTPIRESLQLLETEGFVKMFPGKATQVTEVDRNSINELLPPLAALQSLSAELAIQNLSDETISLLENKNRQFATAIHSDNSFAALKIDEEFHQIIVNAANNPYIIKISHSLQPHVRRLFFHNSIVLTEKSIEEHAQIIALMKKQDTENAGKVMRVNWLRAIDEFHSLDNK